MLYKVPGGPLMQGVKVTQIMNILCVHIIILVIDHTYSPTSTIPIISPSVDGQSDFEFGWVVVVSIGISSTVIIGLIVLTETGRKYQTVDKSQFQRNRTCM